MLQKERKMAQRVTVPCSSDQSGDYYLQNFRTGDVNQVHQHLGCRNEEIQTSSLCASIEKDLPRLSRLSKESKEHTEAEIFAEMIKENKLKDEALQKASCMIKLLKEENEDLSGYIDELEILLKEKDGLIQQLEDEIEKMKPQSGQLITSEVYSHRDGKVLSGSQLFFSFTQKQQQTVRKSEKKIINIDHPSFKEINGEVNISKKLTPYSSNTIAGGKEATVNLLQEISSLLMREQIDGCRGIVEEISDVVAIEEEEQQNIEAELQQKIKEIEEDQIFTMPEVDEKLKKRLFTLESEGESETYRNSMQSILKQYQNCIQSYKEYAAYLKAYLCECINYISNATTSYPIEVKLHAAMPNIMKLIVKDIKQQFHHKIQGLLQQNRELKSILQQLIKNIEFTRLHPQSLNYLPLSASKYQ